jgi:AraC-like DNA-binding protein
VADIVEALWIGRWDLPSDAPHVTRLLGDPCLHLVWEVGGQVAPPERLVGVWTRLWERRLEGRGVVRGIKLRPGAGRAVVTDASAVQNTITRLAEVLPSPPIAADLSPDAADDQPVLLELAAWLDRVRRRDPDTALVVRVVARLRSDPALLRVDQLTRATGFSERTLQRLFRAHVGASPKQVLRRFRLQEAALRLEREDFPSLADLAHELGYADQAHFARDWKDAVAVAPSIFVGQG